MKKIILLICGCVLLLIAAIGVFLPILPTTPIVMLAAVCFSVSSEKCYKFLSNNKYFGPYIENYKTKQGISAADKVRAIVFVWVMLIISMLVMHKSWGTVMFAAIGAGVSVHVLTIKTKPQDK